jgi:hypothetical protein
METNMVLAIISFTVGIIFLSFPLYRLYRRFDIGNHIKRVVKKRFQVKTNKTGKI